MKGVVSLAINSSFLDFTESVVQEVRFAAPFRDLALVVDYYWDLDNPESTSPGPGVLLNLRFKECVEVHFKTSSKAFQIPDNEVSPVSFTIVGWREEMPAGSEFRHYFFQSSHSPEEPWLQVVCRELIVERVG